MQRLGYELVGTGPTRVVLLNDWLCDTSTWDHARTYLDTARFTYAFVDLRGYGRSRTLTGEYTLREAANDVHQLVDALRWDRVALVGHSMSTLVVTHLAQHVPAVVSHLVLITPPPPRGFGADDAFVATARAGVLAGDAARVAMLVERFGDRLSPGWGAYKARRWVETAEATAAAGYIAMYARDGLVTPTAVVRAPTLAITGERDMAAMQADAVRATFGAIAPSLDVETFAGVGHYPMQEMPPLTVATIERFLRR